MKKTKAQYRAKRKQAIRKVLEGTTERPRVFVFRSNKFFYVGVADDEQGKVLASMKSVKNVDGSSKLGEDFGKVLKDKKIEQIVFDRSGYKYHGKVKALAEGLRKSGLKF